MFKLKYLPLLFISANALANSGPAPAPVMEAPRPSAWNVYAGFAGGIEMLRGHRDLDLISPPPETDLTSKHHLSGKAGYVELYTGATYWVPGTCVGFGLDPYVGYSNVKSSDFHNVVVLGDGFTFNESTNTSWSARLALGADVKASWMVNRNNYLFALVGLQARDFEFKYQDPFGSVDKDKWLYAFAWGVGYEHRFTESAIGIKFRNEIFGKKKVHFNFEGSSFRGNVKPTIYTVMLTYKYNLYG